MSGPVNRKDGGEPLDPAMERVRRKLARLLAVSIGTLLVGVMAVLGAVVYKAGGQGAPSEAYRGTITLPAGFTVSDTGYGDGRVLFFGEDPSGDRRVIVFEIATGALIADHVVE